MKEVPDQVVNQIVNDFKKGFIERLKSEIDLTVGVDDWFTLADIPRARRTAFMNVIHWLDQSYLHKRYYIDKPTALMQTTEATDATQQQQRSSEHHASKRASQESL